MSTPFDPHSGERPRRGASPPPRYKRTREFPLALFFAALLFGIICTSCGAVGSDPPPPAPVSVIVTPASAQPYQGETVQFHAAVENAAGSAVQWQVNQANGGNSKFGTIDSTGLYTAPPSVPNPSTVTVSAVLQSDSTKTGSSSVTVLSLSSITGSLSVSPTLSSVTTSQTLQFQILTPGVSDTDVTWSATGGTISSSGKYSPPAAPGAYTVVASLLANPNAAGSATVEVTDFAGTLTWRNDNARSGVNSRELALTPGNVNASKFGKLFSCPIDGYAYAQPLYVPNLLITGKGTYNVIIVATEKDSIYAFDADAQSCSPLWQTSIIPPGLQPIAFPTLSMMGTDIVPFVGITGTPVVDASTKTLYVVAATQTIPAPPNFNPTYSHWLYALNLTTLPLGVEPPGVEIASPGSPISTFNSLGQNQQPALLLTSGTAYVAFGSYGGQCAGETDPCAYHGWLFGYDLATVPLQQTAAFNATPGAVEGGGVWQSGGGPSADFNGDVFMATGDGPYGPAVNGTNYSDSFLHLKKAHGNLNVADYFTPCEQTSLVTTAEDVGTGAPVLILDSQPQLLIGGSKSGSLYVVNLQSMGHYVTSPCPDSPARVQTISVGSAPILSTPLFWDNSIYVAPANNRLLSIPMTAPGIFASSPSAVQSREMFGPQGSTPVISSNGTNNAMLWLVDTLATPNSPAILRAYDPNNLSNEIYDSTMAAKSRDQAGAYVNFTIPTVANGKVYVGTQTELDVYGFLQ